jgi:NAD(P)H-hydrate epimerase
MARLCDLSVPDILARRWSLAREKAIAWGCVVLLKGPYTVIAAPEGWLAVLPVATAALATAGTGDVLAGAIGGLLAQGLDPFAAACAGAWLHGAAGLRCAEEIGDAGVLASDLLARLPVEIRRLHRPHVTRTQSSSPSPADFSDLVAM